MAASTLPSSMKAWQYNSTAGGIEKNMRLNPSAPLPKLDKPSQHLVQVMYAALNPLDWKPAEVGFINRFLIKHPATPGVDIVGRVAQPAAGSSLKPGQLVFGSASRGGISIFAGGALAEYAVAEKDGIRPVPEGLSAVDASTVPIAGTTAYAEIYNFIGDGKRIFINGGSGGVGHFAIQIAKAKGLHVITTCSTRNVEFCRSMGADEVIDYRKGANHVISELQRITQGAKIDLVIDNVGTGFDFFYKMHTFTNPHASLIEVAGAPSLSFISNVFKATMWPGFLGGGKRKFKTFMNTVVPDQLESMSKLMAQGKVKAVIDSQFAFEDAAKAYEKAKTSRAVGKIIVEVAPSLEASKA